MNYSVENKETNITKNKRIARNSFFLSIRMVIVLAISLYTTRVVLRVLGVEDYGIFNVVAGFVSMFGFLNTSMSNGIQRFYNFELGKNGTEGARHVLCTALLIQFILATALVILIECIGLWYLYNKMVIPEERLFAAGWIFQLAILSFILTIMQAPYTAAVMAHERMDFFAIVSVLDAVLKLGIVYLIPLLGADHLVLYGIFIALISLTNFLFYYLYCKLNFQETRFQRYFEKQLFQSMLSFSGWNVFGSFSNTMRNQGVNMIINLFFGPVVNAARGVAMQINSGVTNFVTSILTPVKPQVIQSYARGDQERVMNLTNTISKFCLYVLFLLIVPICIEMNFILTLWLGDNVPEHTQSFCIIILITTAVLIPMNALSTLVHASGKMRNYQMVGGGVKVLSVPAAYIMLKMGYEPEWAFIMIFIFDVIGFVVGLFIIKSLMPFSILDYSQKVFVPLIPVILVGVGATFMTHSVMENGFLRFLTVLFSSTFFLSSTFYWVAMSKAERQLVTNMLSNVYNKRRKK